MEKRRAVSALVAVLVVSGARLARAEDIKFCIRHTGTYDDNGAGEDSWTSDTPREARGAWISAVKNGVEYFGTTSGDGYGIGDPGAGCTSIISLPTAAGIWTLTVHSQGYVRGNEIRAYRSGYPGYQAAWTTYSASGPGTHVVDFNLTDANGAFNVYNAAAFAIYLTTGGLSGQWFDFACDDPAGSWYLSQSTQEIVINEGHLEEKFVITHELGHRVGHLHQSALVNANYNQFYAVCPDEPDDGPGGNVHSMRSKEYAKAGANEGFAHFYAADTWNADEPNADCIFKYYKTVEGVSRPTVDCEFGGGDFALAYHENVCGATAGRAVELDWLRALWDVHTPQTGVIAHDTIMSSWLGGATAWGNTDVYARLEERANTLQGELNTAWDVFKVVNGVDH